MAQRTFEISQEQYQSMADDSGGFCIGCGAEASGVEPDARNYKCEDCGQPSVFGIEELLIMGQIEFTDDD